LSVGNIWQKKNDKIHGRGTLRRTSIIKTIQEKKTQKNTAAEASVNQRMKRKIKTVDKLLGKKQLRF